MKGFYDFLHNVKTQAVLAFFILIGGASILVKGHLTEVLANRVLDIMLLTATFYFGASKSSAVKDETIAKMQSQQQPNIQNADTVQINN